MCRLFISQGGAFWGAHWWCIFRCPVTSDVGNAAIRYAGDVLLYAKLFSRPGNLMRQKEWLFHAGNSREFEFVYDQLPRAIPAVFAPMPEFDSSRHNREPAPVQAGRDINR